MVTRRPRSSSDSGSSAVKTQFQPPSQSCINSLRVVGASTNSLSRSRSGFSPSLVRKFVQRDRMLPAICLTMMAIEFDSGSSGAKSCSSVTCAMASSAIFLHVRNHARDSWWYEVVNECGIRSPPRHGNGDVPVLHPAGVVALDVQRAGLPLVAVDRAAGDAGDFLVVDGGLSVAHHRHRAPDQRHV